MLRPEAGTPEDARTLARANLVDLRGKIDRPLSSARPDYTSRAQLEKTRARIERALEARLQAPVG